MKFKTLLVTALISSLAPAFVLAESTEKKQRGGPDGERPSAEQREARFAETDTNGDGMLSLEEVQNSKGSRMAEHFDKIDTNSDGQLSKDELKAAKKNRPKGGKQGKGQKDATEEE